MSMPSPASEPQEEPADRAEPLDRSISIVIPAYNEAAAIADSIGRVRASLPQNVIEIIVIDDGSTDDTARLAEEAGATVLRHPTNRGYGASLKTGIRAAQGTFVLTMDADGQHRLEDVSLLCQRASTGTAPECLIGARTALLHSPLWRMPGKWLLTAMAQFLTQTKIPDLNSGLRLIRRDIALRYIRLCPQGFSFSTTITMSMLSRGYSVEFLPIQVEKRLGKSSVRVGTGFQVILLVLRLATLFNPLRIFLPASFVCTVAGVAWTIPYTINGQGVTVASMLAIFTGVLLFALGLICDQVAQLRLERYE